MIAECALLTLAFSKHFFNETDFNEVHPSLGVVCEESPIGHMSAGYYYNSERNHTAWLAKRDYVAHSDFFYELGAVVGYEHYPVAPFVRVGYDFGPLEVFALPGLEFQSLGNVVIPIVGVQFKWRFE